ncbi:hypothetical protein ACJRO7_035781 [Eucalyptus globulus]|uniref:Uncharacterized protein n=1 Tax=Eucalyptus globulus TaxID=34317 RepID=A0ABD3JE20_EUCGL
MLTTLPINGMGIPGFVQLGSLEIQDREHPSDWVLPLRAALELNDEWVGLFDGAEQLCSGLLFNDLGFIKKAQVRAPRHDVLAWRCKDYDLHRYGA